MGGKILAWAWVFSMGGTGEVGRFLRNGHMLSGMNGNYCMERRLSPS
jgi:hypothetical protein